ncbi:MAG TPA: hypothetical protein VGO93_07710 [Candidatus Xenobia bacterium]
MPPRKKPDAAKPSYKPGGNRIVAVRLEEQIIAQLKARADDLGRGRGGGVAHYLRVLAYRDLGLPDPEPYAAGLSPRREPKRGRGLE